MATGDVLIHQDRELTAGALQDDGSYDFSGVLAPVAPLIRRRTWPSATSRRRSPPPGGPYRGYPSFAVQPEIVDALAGAGYDLCSTASNHSLDDGADGLVRTLDTLDAAGIAPHRHLPDGGREPAAHDRRRPRHQGRRTSPPPTGSTGGAGRAARGR